MNIWGWMSPAELEWLGAQAAEMTSVVEIGCLHGRSSVALATACPGTVYCIDPWSDDGWVSWKGSVGDKFSNVVGIRAASPAAAALVPEAMIDMVFIDGAHDYASVVADIECWLPRTRRLICGHDYVDARWLDGGEPAFPDVKRVVDELLGADQITVAPDTAIWTYRPT